MSDAKKMELSWNEVERRADLVFCGIREIVGHGKLLIYAYAVPNGGFHALNEVQKVAVKHGVTIRTVATISDADIIVDDVLDSGETVRKLENYQHEKHLRQRPVYVLVDKPKKKLDGIWVSFPWEGKAVPGQSVVDGPIESITRILQFIGEDPEREGLRDTPKRVIKSYSEIFAGYDQTPEQHLKTFTEGACDEMVLLRDIEFYSVCEHHMQPFFGKASIAYIPDGKVVGISKLARILDVYARRLQIQERLTTQIVEALDAHLKPLGSACVIEAQHFCMVCRGVNKQNSKMVTSAMSGVFRDDKSQARSEFLHLLK